MKNVTKINQVDFSVFKKTRVAAYCRVSTDSDEQELSLETQKNHYESYIKANSEWEYAGIYYDDGVSGTKTAKRDGLLRLMEDCEKGLIDLVITKSISRFSRNTTDCLTLVRKLLNYEVYVIFEKENINTGSMESELMLAILASMAESESRSISENEKWSIKKRFQNGTYVISYPPYGYANVDGEMVIVPEQAEVVKEIFAGCLAGKSTHIIAKELNEKGVPTKRGAKWTGATINGILTNLSLSILIQCNDSGYVKKSEKYSAFSVFDRWRRSVDVLLNSRSFYARRAKKAKCTHNHTIAFYRVIVGLSCNDMQLKKPDTVS